MNRYSFLFVLGAVITVIGAVLAITSDYIVSYFIAQVLPLTAGSMSLKKWMTTEVPMHMDIHFFHWVNPEGFLEGKKPILEDKGPYRFRERLMKVNVTVNDSGTITYQLARWWFFDPENTNGSLQDMITTLNPIATSASYVSRNRNALLQMSLSTALRMTKQKIWVTHTVKEMLFEGYSDPMFTIAKTIPNFVQDEMPADKFGWFYNRNGSWGQDGVYTIHTGERDFSKIGKLSSWNYVNKTDFYPGACGEVTGSAGEIFTPTLKKEKPLEMYSPDLCRTMKLEYAKEDEVHGITGYRYVGGRSMMDNGTDDPTTACYCGGECVPQGILNVSTCRFGAPIFLSYPHFLDADPFYLNQVEGLNPDPELHRFRMTVEPYTGTPLDVAGRFQMNLLLQPSNYIAMHNDVPRIFFPMMWFDERATVTPEVASNLKYLLMLRPIVFYTTLTLCFIGLVVALASMSPRFCRARTLLRHGDKRKEDTVLYKRDCIRPLIKSNPEKTSFTETSDPPNSTSTPA